MAGIATIVGTAISGASLAGTSIQEISGAIGTNRNCTLEITNYCRESLEKPEWYCYSGSCKDPLPLHVLPEQKEAASFTKTGGTACGSVFVFSYQLDKYNRFAVLVSVPYDQCSNQNWFGARFIPAGTSTDYHLYYDMYYYAKNTRECQQQKSSAGRPVTITKDGYKVNVIMSDACQAMVELSVFKDYDTSTGSKCKIEMDWVPCKNGQIPDGAYAGGTEKGKKLYVIRADQYGALTPGKLIEGDNHAKIPWNTYEYEVYEYDVLVGEPESFKWVPSKEGLRHSHAVPGGCSEEHEPLLIGRAQHAGGLHPGKVHSRGGTCYISYGGKEITKSDYEILTH